MIREKILFMMICLVGFTSCIIVDDDIFDSPPECKVVSSTGVEPSPYGGAEMRFTVKNTSSWPSAYDVNIHVWLKNGPYVVDEGIAYIHELEGWESRTVTVYFDYINSSYDFDRIESELSWYDEDGYYYD